MVCLNILNKKENAVADEKQKALQDSESCVPCVLYKSPRLSQPKEIGSSLV